MAGMMDYAMFGINAILAIVIIGYFLPLLNAAALGTAVPVIVGLIPLGIAVKSLMAILNG